MEKILATCGYIEINEDGTKHYVGVTTGQGTCFKDMDAWEKGEGVIYISEYSLEDYEMGIISEENMWTRESWVEVVKCYVCDEEHQYPMEFIEWYAETILEQCDWQDLTTMMTESANYFDEDYDDWCEKIKA